MTSNSGKMDVILGIDKVERELLNVFGNSENHSDTESNSQFREIKLRELSSNTTSTRIKFPDKIDSKKQWKLLLLNFI